MASMNSAPLELVNNAYTLATLEDGSKCIFKLNQCLCDPDPKATESLLQPHQARHHGVIIDDVAKQHQSVTGTFGTQSITIDDHNIPLMFDGFKVYCALHKPQPSDLQGKYPIYELTSSRTYDPQRRRYSRRIEKPTTSIEEWRANLGFLSLEKTKETIANTTQYITSMEGETREYMRDYHKTRVFALRPRRLDDTLYVDCFFSSIRSIRGFTCFQMHAMKQSKLSITTNLRKECHAPDAYTDFIINYGAPNKTVSDNAQVYLGNKWTTINRKYCIERGQTVPYHQSSNYAEGEGGNRKYWLVKLLHNTPHAPLMYWCFAMDFLNSVGKFISKTSLGGKCAAELVKGETPDISCYRFPWFSPIWFYAPNLDFPKDRMLPGFFLGLAENTGDGFAYTILPVAEYSDIPTRGRLFTVVRSVVRTRQLSDSYAPHVFVNNDETLEITNRHGEPIGDDSLVDTNNLESHFTPSEERQHCHDSDMFHSPNLDTLDTIPEEHGHSHMPPEPEDVSEELIIRPNENDTTGETIVQTNKNQVHVSTILDDDSDDESDGPNLVSQESYDSAEDELDPISDKDDKNISIADDINAAMDNDFEPPEINQIIQHQFNGGVLEFMCKYDTGDLAWHPFDLVKADDPWTVANYIMQHDLGQRANEIYRRWARLFLRTIRRVRRRMKRSNVFSFHASSFHPTNKQLRSRRSQKLRRAAKDADVLDAKKQSKGKRYVDKLEYGHAVPRKWADILRIDSFNKNTRWQDAVSKEVSALLNMECFDIQSPDYNPGDEFQYVHMHWVYCVKPDLTYKARLVCDGSRVDPKGLNTRATVVKTLSVRLLDLIADAWNKEVLTGDIGNAFIQSYTKEKIYTRFGHEFGDMKGCLAVIVKALYGLTTSAERFRSKFADLLRSIGFKSSRYDRDVWMIKCPNGNGYDYVCTHVDDFKIIADDPFQYLDCITAVLFVKTHGPREYYLGNDYQYHASHNMWTYDCSTYEKEALRKAEEILGCLPKKKTVLPVTECHPEMDQSPLLNLHDHRTYQVLLGMLQWNYSIGRPELGPAISSLNRFGACPREYHLTLLKHAFCYLKYTSSISRNIAIDSNPMEFERHETQYQCLIPDFLQDYPDAKEEIDPGFPDPYGDPLETTILVDSDHAHDRKTRRSLTGLIAFVGSTPVLWLSKRQSTVASSTYSAEFSALRTATEEAMNLRYCLRCLGVNIPHDGSCSTKLFGDNLSVILSASNPGHDLSKKHVAISFHVVREAIAAGIVQPYWLKGEYNLSDIMTKQIPSGPFGRHTSYIYWKPDWHLRTQNGLDQHYIE